MNWPTWPPSWWPQRRVPSTIPPEPPDGTTVTPIPAVPVSGPARDPLNMRYVVWLGVLVVVVVSWLLAATFTNVWTILATVVISIVGPLVMLRMTRGSLAAAEKAADARQYRREAIDKLKLPKRVQKSLLDSEKVLLSYHEHPISLWPWWLTVLAVQPIALIGILKTGLVLFLGALWLLVILATSVRLWAHARNSLYVSNRRLFRIRGVVGEHHSDMPVLKITDVSMSIGATSKVLAWLRIIDLPYATIHVESAGQNQALEWLYWVPNGREVKNTMLEEGIPEGRPVDEVAYSSDD